ncbi:putative ABC transporter permease [Candidatus Woesearchaeota archaeon]|nr:putative ABC transporter permease [Candidatus Woesearchaeota archaeon]
MWILIIIEFVIFSFIGCLIDSLHKSIMQQKLILSGAIIKLICPVYGIGALFLILNFKLLSKYKNWIQIIIGFIGLILIELISGLILEYIFRIKLWDYSNNFMNFYGWIDLQHTVYWSIVTLIFKKFIYPMHLKSEGFFKAKVL